ncbi:Receptor-like cytosolic serine/threonine-protein kinase RBK2 [Sesamum angolense]|uniref:non-specific serine/threonine protein kinase n=1 Tax=Sesamum angolense TaxID=2727404 RepID=A0AAE1X8Z3_9LAMI|nr:Receptor-like cytosolic serine/threonine-protein kinase RBK2 [Sesamum angolense]
MEKEKEKKKANVYSPDTVLEDFLRTSESETDSSKTSTSELEAVDPKPASRWAEFFQLLRFKSKRKLATLHPLNALSLSKRFGSSMREDVSSVSNPLIDADLNYFKPQWKNFSFSELQTATSNFCQGYLIGKGGYAEVYRGRLRGGQLVAIKRLMKGPMEERIGDFLSELGIMAHVNHPNTAKLIGYGLKVECTLSLNFSHWKLGLYASQEKVEWDIRYKVAVGTAKGLLYLHEGCQRRIIHRDIKAANILLTEDFEPQICDFGLAKWLPDRWTHLTVSKFEGTFGYLAPEFLMHGIVDEKTDVFAFGVSYWNLSLGDEPSITHSKALLCGDRLVDAMQVLLLLRGSCGSSDIIKKCKKLSSWKKYYKGLFSAEKYSFGRGIGGLTLQTQMAIEA